MSSEQLENFEELARRAVACKHWRWMPGMLLVTKADNRFRLVELDFDAQDRWEWKGQYSTPVPDLRDPATLGCLLALVREAHGDPEIVVSKYEYSDGWTIGTQLEWEGIHSLWGSDGAIWGWSEAEVLVKALEAAP